MRIFTLILALNNKDHDKNPFLPDDLYKLFKAKR